MASKKLYIDIAARVRSATSTLHRPDRVREPMEAAAIVLDAVADAFAADNPRFDREQFADACGFWSGEAHTISNVARGIEPARKPPWCRVARLKTC